MLQKFEKRNPARFWKWFSRHEDEFLKINEENFNTIFLKMFKYLEKYNSYLGFEFIKDREDKKKELVITANGTVPLFDTVKYLINAAPERLKERWVFTALRQATLEEIIIHFDDMVLGSKDIYYELEESETEPGKWDILIYIKGIEYDSPESEEYIAEVMMSALDGIIGEYTNATKISDLILVEKGELEDPKNIMQLKNDINE